MDPDPSSLPLLLVSFDFSQIFSIIVLMVLLLCSALISGSEVALFSLAPTDFEPDETKRSAKEIT